jgi:DNA-binding SARP family transcriptional activator
LYLGDGDETVVIELTTPVRSIHTAAMIRFVTLGALELRRPDGSEIRSILQGPKRLALLSYLVLARPVGFQRRDRLLSLLWPEVVETRARATLRQTVHALRIELGEGVVVNRGGEEIALDQNRLWCDARAFEQTLSRGDRESALALYAGPLLDGFHPRGVAVEYEHWLDREREHLHMLAVDAAHRSAIATEDGHDADAAQRSWTRLLSLTPYDEHAVRRLMQLHAREGRPTAAHAVYQRFEHRLRADLEVGPEPATVALAHKLSGPALPADAAVAATGLQTTGRGTAHAPLRASSDAAAGAGRHVDARRIRRTVLLAGTLVAGLAFMASWAAWSGSASDGGGTRVPDGQSVDRPPTEVPEAHTFYLRAMDYRSRPGWHEANAEIVERLLERAIELDPDFALAYAQLSMLHGGRWARHDRTDARMAQVRTTAETAIRLAPELPEARLALGYFYFRGLRDYERARTEFERGWRAGGGTFAISSLAWIDRITGRWDDALDKLRAVSEMSPLNENFATALAATYALMRRYEEAARAYDRAAELSPDVHRTRIGKGLVYVRWLGVTDTLRHVLSLIEPDAEIVRVRYFLAMIDRDFARALRELDAVPADVFDRIPDTQRYHLQYGAAHQLAGDPAGAAACFEAAVSALVHEVGRQPDDAAPRSALGKAYAGLGRKTDALREARRAVALVPDSVDAMEGVTYLIDLAAVYAQLEEPQLAVQVLERVLSVPARLSVHDLRLDPRWDPLRGHASFRQLIDPARTGAN